MYGSHNIACKVWSFYVIQWFKVTDFQFSRKSIYDFLLAHRQHDSATCNGHAKTDVASILVTAHLSLIGHLAIYSAIG